MAADDKIKVRIKCNHQKCNVPQSYLQDVETTIRKYQLGLFAIWFHAFHEGHKFSYWENDELILGEGDVVK